MGFCVKLFFNNKYTEILPSNGTVIALYYQFMKHKLCLLQSKSKVPGVGPVLVSPSVINFRIWQLSDSQMLNICRQPCLHIPNNN